MSGLSVFDIAGRAMSAQLLRLGTTASNLANAGSVAGSEAAAYRPLKPVFASTYADGLATVDVERIKLVAAGPGALARRGDGLFGGQVLDADPTVRLRSGALEGSNVSTAQSLTELLEQSRGFETSAKLIRMTRDIDEGGSADGIGSVRQGALEASNVSTVQELVDMIETQRAYEVNAKVINAADEMARYVNQNV